MRLTSPVRLIALSAGILSIAFAGASSAHAAGVLQDFSWSASSLVASATATYTFSYTTSTEVPGSTATILLLSFPFGFTAGGVENLSATVDGVPQTLDGSTYYADRALYLRVVDTVPAGSDVVVTIQNVVNANTEGGHSFQLNPYTAAFDGSHLDDPASVNSIVLTAAPANPFDGGTGTSEDPYQISTCEQLQDMSDDLTASYQLTDDINCSDTENWNEGAGFIPVGNNTTSFTGHFDGGTHVISDLFIHPSGGYGGLFGAIGAGGSAIDVGLSDVDLSVTTSYAGALTASNQGTVSGTYVTGTVTGSGTALYIGGLIGFQGENGTTANSYSRATVHGYEYVSGLVARNYVGTVTNSYAAGAVSVGSLVDSAGLTISSAGGTAPGSFYDIVVTGQTTGDGSGTTTRL